MDLVKNRKNTNSKFVSNEKSQIECPHCQSNNIIRNGYDKNNVQTYQCKNCRKKFNACTNTLVARIKLTYALS